MLLLLFIQALYAEPYRIYGLYQAVDLGLERPQKDYYISMGTRHGLSQGSTLEVIRHTASFDAVYQKFFTELSFPIAHLKVIHADTDTAIARLDHMLDGPNINPKAIMAGDSVRLLQLPQPAKMPETPQDPQHIVQDAPSPHLLPASATHTFEAAHVPETALMKTQ